MASEQSRVRDYAIIGLLLLNVGISSYSAFGPHQSPSQTSSTDQHPSLDVTEAQASALAADILRLYNAKDDVGLFNKFDALARAQLTQEQLSNQLAKLYPVMGTVSDAAFSNVVFAGNDAGRDYYTLNYKVRMAGGPFNAGDMRLTVTKKENGLGLVGFFLNGTSQTSRQ